MNASLSTGPDGIPYLSTEENETDWNDDPYVPLPIYAWESYVFGPLLRKGCRGVSYTKDVGGAVDAEKCDFCLSSARLLE